MDKTAGQFFTLHYFRCDFYKKLHYFQCKVLQCSPNSAKYNLLTLSASFLIGFIERLYFCFQTFDKSVKILEYMKIERPVYLNELIRTKDSDGKPIRVTLEVDFVANKGSKRYYIQSAWRIPDEEKLQQETRSLNAISDSFKKIVVTGENIRLKRDENGIATIPIIQFLKDPNSLDL